MILLLRATDHSMTVECLPHFVPSRLNCLEGQGVQDSSRSWCSWHLENSFVFDANHLVDLFLQ